MIGWMFPGQGSQQPAMAAGFESCGPLLDIAERTLGPSIRWVASAKGNKTWPADLLQPAIYLTDVGAAMALSEKGAEPDAVLGHSLGEYAALVAAGCLTYEAGLELVHLRGIEMMKAGRDQAGGMAAVMGASRDLLSQLCEEIGGVWIANLNTDEQTVLSGKDDALAKVAARLREQDLRVIRLKVPVAAHTPLMEPAAKALEAALQAITLEKPRFTFFSCADAAIHDDPAEIKDLLIKGMTSPVLFSQTIQAVAASGVDHLVEVGPGKVLSGLLLRIAPEISVDKVGSDTEVAEFLSSISAFERSN
jgi:[acyl-carrier-protein] S-malonyltransferase